MKETAKASSSAPGSRRQFADKDIDKLIVVTPSGGRHRGRRLDSELANLIDDGLAMYEQELFSQVRAARTMPASV